MTGGCVAPLPTAAVLAGFSSLHTCTTVTRRVAVTHAQAGWITGRAGVAHAIHMDLQLHNFRTGRNSAQVIAPDRVPEYTALGT